MEWVDHEQMPDYPSVDDSACAIVGRTLRPTIGHRSVERMATLIWFSLFFPVPQEKAPNEFKVVAA